MRESGIVVKQLAQKSKGMDKARQFGVKAQYRERVGVEKQKFECQEKPDSRLLAPRVPSTGHGTY